MRHKKSEGVKVLKSRIGIILPLLVAACVDVGYAQDTPAPAAPAGQKAEVVTPLELVNSTPKGQLKNPYTGNEEAIKAGRGFFFGFGCNGCHGGTGGGGMGPPINNVVWVYGSDDDTLFRLITLGSDELQKRGYFRKGMENVVAPMPPVGQLVDSADNLWKIIAFIRSIYTGDPSRKNW
jgi:mono/diheme cytochrome c family protein